MNFNQKKFVFCKGNLQKGTLHKVPECLCAGNQTVLAYTKLQRTLSLFEK